MEARQPTPGIQRPRRLLHVPSRTSLAWDEAALRTGKTSPLCNILSHTRGRIAVREDDPALAVHKISWKILAIQPAHFLVDEFEQVL